MFNGFELINSSLSMQSGEAKIVGRMESYSCKMISTEKQRTSTLDATTTSDTICSTPSVTTSTT